MRYSYIHTYALEIANQFSPSASAAYATMLPEGARKSELRF